MTSLRWFAMAQPHPSSDGRTATMSLGPTALTSKRAIGSGMGHGRPARTSHPTVCASVLASGFVVKYAPPVQDTQVRIPGRCAGSATYCRRRSGEKRCQFQLWFRSFEEEHLCWAKMGAWDRAIHLPNLFCLLSSVSCLFCACIRTFPQFPPVLFTAPPPSTEPLSVVPVFGPLHRIPMVVRPQSAYHPHTSLPPHNSVSWQVDHSLETAAQRCEISSCGNRQQFVG